MAQTFPRFFLAIAVLQFFPKFSTISPGLVILPLIVVWGATSLKDGYEDVKRHQSDRAVNHATTLILAGGGWVNHNSTGNKSKTFVRALTRTGKPVRPLLHLRKQSTSTQSEDIEMESIRSSHSLPKPWETQHSSSEIHLRNDAGGAHWAPTAWEDVRVGDFVKICENEAIPADILICSTSDDDDVAFVETKNLDGETNLKSRKAVSGLLRCDSAKACADGSFAFKIECDRPDVSMERMNAAVILEDGRKESVDTQMVLLRGTVLRNTKWAIGVVLFTGTETKIMLNSGATPSKRSRVERQMNPQV